MADEAELRGAANEIEHLLDELRAMVPPPAWQRIERVVGDLAALYAGGLERALGHARAIASSATAFDDRVCADELLSSLLVIHGLHPLPTAERIRRAIAGSADLVEVRDDGAVLIRAQAGAEARVRRAIAEAAPEVTEVELVDALVQLREARVIEMTGLRRIVAAARAPAATEEVCELCGVAIAESHRHLVDVARHRLACACRPCALLFASHGTYRTVPERVLVDDAFAIAPARWGALGVPVGLAFFFYSSPLGRHVACYPSPAGVTEADVEAGLWAAIAEATPLAAKLEPDVEALLVHGERGADRLACFLVPIDAPYELTGRLRRCWRGFTGGDDARRELRAFFTELRRRGGMR